MHYENVMENYSKKYHKIKDVLNDLQKENSSLLKNFGQLHFDVLAKGALPNKYKELMALCTAVALRCRSSMAYHMHDAIAAGASKEEILETIGVAVMMGGSPAVMSSTDAYLAYHQLVNDCTDYGLDDTIFEDELLGE